MAFGSSGSPLSRPGAAPRGAGRPPGRPSARRSDSALVGGEVASGFEAVRDEFERNFSERRELGAAVAAYVEGEKVVDLWGGVRDARDGSPWERDTLVILYSTSKGLSATACARRRPEAASRWFPRFLTERQPRSGTGAVSGGYGGARRATPCACRGARGSRAGASSSESGLPTSDPRASSSSSGRRQGGAASLVEWLARFSKAGGGRGEVVAGGEGVVGDS